jgi:TonB family protein
MTAGMALSNLASFGLQVTMLVAGGAALVRLLRIDESRALLAFWRLLLIVCLALPFCQPWKLIAPEPPTMAVVNATPIEESTADIVTSAPERSAWTTANLVLIVLASGIAIRALWLAIGAYGLRSLRRAAWPLEPLPDSVRSAQKRIATRAGMYVSDRITSPITFGVVRPIVVFPPTVSMMPPYVQEAIACHELLHVRRHDWLSEILEEVIRSVLWFHPAIWWLIGRIQLTREQVVDQAAVRLIASKERYVESLLTVALGSSPVLFTPASSFLRRHLLKMRVARILQESAMTTRRLIASLTAGAVALAVAGIFATRLFPLQAQGRAAYAANGEPVQVLKGAEHLLHGEIPDYPRRAIAQKIEGDVVVDMTLDDRGEVADARILSGPEELRRATLAAVLQWHYSPSAVASSSAQATVRFRLPPGGLTTAEDAGKLRIVHADSATADWEVELTSRAAHFDELSGDADIKMIKRKIEVGGLVMLEVEPESAKPVFDQPLPLAQVRAERVSEETLKEVLAQAGITIGDAISEDTAKRIQKVASEIDEHVRVEFRKSGDGLVLTFMTR